ncbi:MAG: cupredoxin domain-containing protein [Candidatus Coatesbacteria bacterium]|nr:MAG: cupredoxin domain-containing protein [Candidatus Coatesbacteria bacterium]
MRRVTLIMLALAACAAASLAATEIQIRDFAFVPANAVIMKGENVKWTNFDQVTHTSTSDTQIWDSGDLTHGKSFEFRFNSTGSFPYHCTYHIAMKGTIRVTETPVEPASFGRVKALFR